MLSATKLASVYPARIIVILNPQTWYQDLDPTTATVRLVMIQPSTWEGEMTCILAEALLDSRPAH